MTKLCVVFFTALLLALGFSPQVARAQSVTGTTTVASSTASASTVSATTPTTVSTIMSTKLPSTNSTTNSTSSSCSVEINTFTLLFPLALTAAFLHGWSQ